MLNVIKQQWTYQFAMDWSMRPIIMGLVLLLNPLVDSSPTEVILL